MKEQDTTNNTAARVSLDTHTQVREVTEIIRNRQVVAEIKRYGEVVEPLMGWGYTHLVYVPPETERLVGYPIEGHYHVTI